ncbi:magnesium/cobalt transporter CorA [Mariniblastus fucicola]|uniref:Magnesium transport protein CorA n=1 Tax=Mariniblastus fucicola TaxID=980251 RepID=A0A5B9PE24_9BACT|nr:magnesium/cobalt transporter CorA [Mariniblastus fucicola]QEG24658.1 Magnesium transport protein CorA [Mariniblastus fucicola]
MRRKAVTRSRKRAPHRSQPGAPPGTLVSHHEGETSVEVIAYSSSRFEVWEETEIERLVAKCDAFDVVWINVIGLADLDLIRLIGKTFNIHQLTLEDINNIHQRAKYENFEEYDYFITRMARFDADIENRIETEQLSIILMDKFVLTFQLIEVDCLDPVRRRLKEKSGLIRERGNDYLVYALIDSVIDHYFPIVDQLGDRVTDFDDALQKDETTVSAIEVHQVRRELLSLARLIRPHREMLSRILREPSRFSAQTRLFLNDCMDHALQLGETIETNREICSDLRSYHLALIGNRTNDVMKTLTIVSTIFIPLSFIAGLYGMNFEYMPELKWKLGYFAALGAMAAVAVSLLAWFRSRGWFGT